jgi:hypothetical protein
MHRSTERAEQPQSGRFNLTTRMYQPAKAMLDGTYKLPPVTGME